MPRSGNGLGLLRPGIARAEIGFSGLRLAKPSSTVRNKNSPTYVSKLGLAIEYTISCRTPLRVGRVEGESRGVRETMAVTAGGSKVSTAD